MEYASKDGKGRIPVRFTRLRPRCHNPLINMMMMTQPNGCVSPLIGAGGHGPVVKTVAETMPEYCFLNTIQKREILVSARNIIATTRHVDLPVLPYH